MLPGQQLSGEQKEELKTAARITAVSDGSCVFNSFILALIHGIKQNPSYFDDKKEVFEGGFLKFLGEYISNQELKEDAHLYRLTQLDQKAADEFDKNLAPFPDIKPMPIKWETFKAYLEKKDSQYLQEVLALPLRKYTAQRMLSDQKLKDYLLNKELKQLFDTVQSVTYSLEKKEKENQALNTIQIFVSELRNSSEDINLFLATFQPRKDLLNFKEYIRDLKDINEINEPLKGLLLQKCRIDPDKFLLSSDSDLGSVRCVMVKLNELHKQGKDFSAVTTWWNTSGYKEYASELATSYQWGALAQLKTLQEIWRVKIECRLGQGGIIDLDEKKVALSTLKVSSDPRRERIKAECIRILKREKKVISWHDEKFTQFTWNENVVTSIKVLNDKFILEPSIEDLVYSVLITDGFEKLEIKKVISELQEEMSSQWVPPAPDPYIGLPIFQLVHKDKQHWDAILTMSMVDYVLVELLKLKVIPGIVLQTESNIYSGDYFAIRENAEVLKLKKDLMSYGDIQRLCDLIKNNNDKKNTVEKDYMAVQKHIAALGITPTVLDEKIYEVQQKRFEKKDGQATLYVEKIYDLKSLPSYVKQSHLETWIKYLIDTKQEEKVVNLLQGDFLTRLVSGPAGQNALIKLYQNVQTPQIIKDKIKSIYILYNSKSEIHIEESISATLDDKVNLLINKVLPAEFQYLIDFSPLLPRKAFLVSLLNSSYELANLQKDLIDAIKGKKIAKLIEINEELSLLNQVHIKNISDSQRISPPKKEEKSDPVKEFEEKIKELFKRIEVEKKEAKFSDEEKLNLIIKINPHLLEAANELLLKSDNPLQEIIQQIEYCITTPHSFSFDQSLLQVTLQSKSAHLNNIYHEVLALRTTYQSQKAIQDEQRKLQQKSEEKKKQEAAAIEKFNKEIISLSQQVIKNIQTSLSSKVDYKDSKFDAKQYSQIYEELLKKRHKPQLEQLVESEIIKKAKLISDVIIAAFDPQFSLDDISKKLSLAKTNPLVIDINKINSQVLVVRERQKREQEELRRREKEAEERRAREESERKREEKKREEDRRKVEAELKKTATIKEIVNLTIAKLVSDEKPLKLIKSQLQPYEAEFTHMAEARYRDEQNNLLIANAIAEQVQTEMQGTNPADDIQKNLGLQSNTGLAAFIREQVEIIEKEREQKKVEEAKLNEEKRKAEVIKQAELKKTTAINTTVDLIISKIIADSKSQLIADQLQQYRKELTIMAEGRYVSDQNNQEIADIISQLVHKEILGNNPANVIAKNLGLSSDKGFSEFIHQQAEKRRQEQIRHDEEETRRKEEERIKKEKEALRQQEVKLSQIVDQLISRIDKRFSELKDYESLARHKKTITEIARRKLTTTTMEALEKSPFIDMLFSYKMQEDDASLAIIAGKLGLSDKHEFVKFIYDQNIKLRSKYIDNVIEDKKLVALVGQGLQTKLNENPYYRNYQNLTKSVVENPILHQLYKKFVKDYLKENLYGDKFQAIELVVSKSIEYSINELYKYFVSASDLQNLQRSSQSKTLQFARLISTLQEQIENANKAEQERIAQEAAEKAKALEEQKKQQAEAKLGAELARQCKSAEYKPIRYNPEDLLIFDEKSTHAALVQLHHIYGDQTVTKVTQWFNPINNESKDILLGTTTNETLLKFGNDLLYQRKQKQISHAYTSTTLIIKEIDKKIKDEYKLSPPNPYLSFLGVFYSELKQPLIEIFKNQTNLMPDDFIRELGILIKPDNESDEKALIASLKSSLDITKDSDALVQLARSINKLNAGARASQAKDKDASAEFIIQYIKQRLEEKTSGADNFYQGMDLSAIKPYLISIIAPGLEIKDMANEIASLLTIDHIREKPHYIVRPELQNPGFLKVIFELNQKARLPYLRQILLEMKLPFIVDQEYYADLKIGQLLIKGLDDHELILLAGDKTKDELIAFMQQFINIELTNTEKINIKLDDQLPGSNYRTLKDKFKRNIFNINSTALMQKQGEKNLNALIKKLKSLPTYREIEDIEVMLKHNLDHVSIKQLQYYGILDKLLRHPDKYFEIAKNVTSEYKQDAPYAMAVGILEENIKQVNQKAFEIAQLRSEPILKDVLAELKMSDLDGFYPSLFESFLDDSQVLIDMERLIYTIFDRDEKRRGDFVSPIDIISTILKPGLTEGSIAEELKRVPSTKDYVALVQAAKALNSQALQLQKKAALLWENAVAEIEEIDTYKYYPDFKQELFSLKTNLKLLNYIYSNELDLSTLSQMLVEFMDFHTESKQEPPISNIYDIVARNKKVALEIITNHAVSAIQNQMLAFNEFKYATFKPSEEDKAAILRLFKDQKLHPQELFDTLRQFVNPLLNDEKQLAESMQEQFENLGQHQCVQLARIFAKYNKLVYEQINIRVLAYANEFFSEFKGTPLEKLYNPLKQQISDDPKNIKYLADFFMNAPINGDKTKFIALLRSVVVPELSEDDLRERLENYEIASPNKSKFRRLINDSNDKVHAELSKVVTNAIKDIVKQEKFTLYFPDLKGLSRDRQFQHSLIILAKSQDLSDKPNIDRFFRFFKLEEKPDPIQISHDLLASGFLTHEQEERDKLSTVIAELNQKAYERQREAKQSVDAVINQLQDEFKQNPIMARLYPNLGVSLDAIKDELTKIILKKDPITHAGTLQADLQAYLELRKPTTDNPELATLLTTVHDAAAKLLEDTNYKIASLTESTLATIPDFKNYYGDFIHLLSNDNLAKDTLILLVLERPINGLAILKSLVTLNENDSKKDSKRIEDVLNAILIKPEDVIYRQALAKFITSRNAVARQRKAEDIVEKTIARLDGEFNGAGERKGLYPDLKAKLEAISDELIELVKHPVINCDIAKFYDHLMQNQRMRMGSSLPLFWPPSEELFSDDFIEQDRIRDSLDEKLSNRTRDTISRAIVDLNGTAQLRQTEAKRFIELIINQLEIDILEDQKLARFYPGLNNNLNGIREELIKLILTRTLAFPDGELRNKMRLTAKALYDNMVQSLIHWQDLTGADADLERLLKDTREQAQKLRADTVAQVDAGLSSLNTEIKEYNELYANFAADLKVGDHYEALIQLALAAPRPGPGSWIDIIKDLTKYDANDVKEDFARIRAVLETKLTREQDSNYCNTLATFISERNARARQHKAETIVDSILTRLQHELDDKKESYPKLKIQLEQKNVRDILIKLVKSPEGINCGANAFYAFLTKAELWDTARYSQDRIGEMGNLIDGHHILEAGEREVLINVFKRLNAERVVLQGIPQLHGAIEQFKPNPDNVYTPFPNLYPEDQVKSKLLDEKNREGLIQLVLSRTIDCDEAEFVKYLARPPYMSPAKRLDENIERLGHALQDEIDEEKLRTPLAETLADLNDKALKKNIALGIKRLVKPYQLPDAEIAPIPDNDGIGFDELYPGVIPVIHGDDDLPDLKDCFTGLHHDHIIDELGELVSHANIYFSWRSTADFLAKCLNPLEHKPNLDQVFTTTFGDPVPACPNLRAYLAEKVQEPLPADIALLKVRLTTQKLKARIKEMKEVKDNDLVGEVDRIFDFIFEKDDGHELIQVLVRAISHQTAKKDSDTLCQLLNAVISLDTERYRNDPGAVAARLSVDGLRISWQDLQILGRAIATFNTQLYRAHQAHTIIDPVIADLSHQINVQPAETIFGVDLTFGCFYPNIRDILNTQFFKSALVSLSQDINFNTELKLLRHLDHVIDMRADRGFLARGRIYNYLLGEMDNNTLITGEELALISYELSALNQQARVVADAIPAIFNTVIGNHHELFPENNLKACLTNQAFVKALALSVHKDLSIPDGRALADIISQLFVPEAMDEAAVVRKINAIRLAGGYAFNFRPGVHFDALCGLIAGINTIAAQNLVAREEVKHVRIQTTARMFTRLVGKTIRTRDAEEAALDVLRGMPPITDHTDRAEVERMRAAIVAQMNKGTFKLPTNLALIREGSPKEMKPMVKVDPVVTGECKLLLPDQAKDYQITDGPAKDVEIGAQFVSGRLTVGVVKDNNQDLTKTLPTNEVMPSDKQLAIATSVIFLAIANAGNSATNPLYIWPIDAGNQSQEIRAKATILIAAVSDGAFHVVNRSGVNYTPSAAELAAARQFFDGYIKPFAVTPEDHKDMNDDIHALRDAEDRAQARMPEYKRQGYAEMLQHLGEEAENKGRIEAKDIAGPARRLLNNGG